MGPVAGPLSSRRAPLGALAFLVLAFTAGCSGEAPGESQTTTTSGTDGCKPGEELFRGACVDPARRYEPEERIDNDNVIAFGEPVTGLTLPDPPKSGFRVIVPPKQLTAGEETEYCVSWPYPSFQNHVVYAGRIYTTKGLHHSNLIAKPVDPDKGQNPYPACHPGASDAFANVPAVIPDVLFANSTQVVGEETLAFPEGKGFRVDPTREIITDIHFLNTTPGDLRAEVVYDFFTMPESELVDEVAPFVLSVNDFLVPAHSQGEVGSTCTVFGGTVVAMMPHTHKLASAFTVDLLDLPEHGGAEKRVIDNGPFDGESHIATFAPALDLTNVGKLRFACQFNNVTDHDVTWGIGNNEMCILFGYVYPIRSQFAAYAPYQGDPCQSYQIGLFHP